MIGSSASVSEGETLTLIITKTVESIPLSGDAAAVRRTQVPWVLEGLGAGAERGRFVGTEYRRPQDKPLNEKNLKKDRKSQLGSSTADDAPAVEGRVNQQGRRLPPRKQIWKVTNHHPSLSGLSTFLKRRLVLFSN